MALVQDIHDPGKQGMFSKAGRFTTEKYIIFQRKDEIMFGKKRVLRVNQFTQPQDNKDQKMEFKKKDDKKDEKNAKLQENQPFYKQVSRESRNQLKSVKNSSKPVGYYKPKYSEIDKSQHLIWNILKVHQNQTHGRSVYSRPDTTEADMARAIPEKLNRKRVTGMIEIEKQIDRNQSNVSLAKKNDPHEDRFKMLELPKSWSNIPKPQLIFDLKVQNGRDDNKGYSTKEHQPDYEPNWKFGRLDFSKSRLQIAKIPPRKPMFKVSDTQNEKFFDYDRYVKKNKSHVFRNIQSSPNFDKILPREIDPGSPLPSFMQKHVNMRSTLTTLHHKMLENNYFSDGRFQSTTSEFAKSASNFRRTRKEDEDEEEESFDQNQQ